MATEEEAKSDGEERNLRPETGASGENRQSCVGALPEGAR